MSYISDHQFIADFLKTCFGRFHPKAPNLRSKDITVIENISSDFYLPSTIFFLSQSISTSNIIIICRASLFLARLEVPHPMN